MATIRSMNRATISEARKVLKISGVNSLLSGTMSNPKVAKNGKAGALTAPLHLAPFNASGYQVCPMASSGCAAACLHTAGNLAYFAAKDKARKNRTKAFFKHRNAFLTVLIAEIDRHVERAKAQGMAPAIRLNATSDLPWESYRIFDPLVDHNGKSIQGMNLMEIFPSVEFYDYTKIPKRAFRWANGHMPGNYHITFSRAEDNGDAALQVLQAGGNVTVVIHGRDLPSTLWGFPVVDGDSHDYRPADPTGVIVGLRAKGDAKRDTSGFVVSV